MATQDYSNIEIDLLKLNGEGHAKKWNEFLTDCYNKKQIGRLIQTRIGLQKGADSLAKKNMNSASMIEFYLRLNKSIEDTAKKIIRLAYPMPTDNGPKNEFATKKWIEAKRERDNQFESFILRSSY